MNNTVATVEQLVTLAVNTFKSCLDPETMSMHAIDVFELELRREIMRYNDYSLRHEPVDPEHMFYGNDYITPKDMSDGRTIDPYETYYYDDNTNPTPSVNE